MITMIHNCMTTTYDCTACTDRDGANPRVLLCATHSFGKDGEYEVEHLLEWKATDPLPVRAIFDALIVELSKEQILRLLLEAEESAKAAVKMASKSKVAA